MSNQSSVAERVGQAWNHHREGRNDMAISEFESILKQSPNDIDANYGLGLAQKSARQIEKARNSFQNTLRLVDQSREAYAASRSDNNIKTPEDDRFMMLSRMVTQRLAEIDRT